MKSGNFKTRLKCKESITCSLEMNCNTIFAIPNDTTKTIGLNSAIQYLHILIMKHSSAISSLGSLVTQVSLSISSYKEADIDKMPQA